MCIRDRQGLHRARYDQTLQLKAVSALSILQRLDELGYEPILINEARVHWKPTSILIAAAVALPLLAVSPWLPTLHKAIFSVDGGQSSQPEQVEITLRDATTNEQIRREFEMCIRDRRLPTRKSRPSLRFC